MTPADMNQLSCLIGSGQGSRLDLGQPTNQPCQIQVTATTITVDGVSHVISDQAYSDGSTTWSRYYTDLWNDSVYGAVAQLHLVSSDAAASSVATFEFFAGSNVVIASVISGTLLRVGCQITVR
jgi:hypothetical protein